MPTYGRSVVLATGYPIMAAAEGLGKIDWKTGGITIDWTTVPPATGAGTTLNDGTLIAAGNAGIEYGTVMTKITSSGKYAPFTAAAPGATTLNGATGVGATTLVLTSAASIYPGDLLTVDTAGNLETLRVIAVNGNTVTVATPAAFAHLTGVAVSKVNEGRQLLTPGETFVLNASTLQNQPLALTVVASDNPGVFYGGSVWLQRLKVGGTNQPTLAQLMAACPRLQPVEMS